MRDELEVSGRWGKEEVLVDADVAVIGSAPSLMIRSIAWLTVAHPTIFTRYH